MKKYLLILLACILFNVLSFGQIKLGIRAGLSTVSYKANDVIANTDFKVEKSNSAQYGYHFGLIGQIKITSFFVQPELLLSSISNKYKITDITTNLTSTQNDRRFNIDFPIIFGYKIGPLKLEAGPTGRILLSQKNELEDATGFKSQFNKASWAFQTGVGVEFLKLMADLKYEFALSKFGKGINIDGAEHKFDSRVSQFVLSVGYFF